MQVAMLNSESKSDMSLLLQLAKKLNIKSKILSEEEIEDIGLINAMIEGETGETVDLQSYLESLAQ